MPISARAGRELPLAAAAEEEAPLATPPGKNGDGAAADQWEGEDEAQLIRQARALMAAGGH